MREPQLPNPPPAVRRILVVDDAVEIRYLLTLRLHRAGFLVMAAGSSAEALTLVRQQGLPALALVDLVLPGVDGLTLAQELCRLGNVPIILLSALSDAQPKAHEVCRCVKDCVTKPFVWAEVLARIQWVFAQGGRLPAHPRQSPLTTIYGVFIELAKKATLRI